MRLRVGIIAPILAILAVFGTLFAGKFALQVYKWFFIGLYKLLYWSAWVFVKFAYYLLKGMYLGSKMAIMGLMALYISFKEKKEAENEEF